MKRRELIRYTVAGALSAIATGWVSAKHPLQAQTANNTLVVKYLGHTCFLFTGGGMRILVNPFRTLGCTAGYRLPRVQADLVLISSQLLDEGAAENLPGNPQILFEPGVFRLQGLEIQGIGMPHDRMGGRRFGTNVAWRWKQAGINILHLGGAATKIEFEQKVLMGTPDLALIPVGGSMKAYNPQEAKEAIDILKPKVAIPTHYRTEAADANSCDLVSLDEFLKLVDANSVKRINDDQIAIKPSDLPKEGTLIRVLNYRNALQPR